MKGNPLRKRYVLIYSIESEFTDSLARRIASLTGASRKFIEGRYAVILTDQIRKAQTCSTIESEFPSIKVITVSGTIKKCRKVMLEHKNPVPGKEKSADNLSFSRREG